MIDAMMPRRCARPSWPRRPVWATTGSSSAPRSPGVRDLVDVYRQLAPLSDYPLHLGLTEAGMAMKGIVASTAGLAILLNEGIGDTIRVSLTPEPGRRSRARGRGRPAGAPVAGPAQLPAPGECLPGLRPDHLDFFQVMAQEIQAYLKDQMPVWAEHHPGRRGDARRGHGLRRQRTGREQARRHRDQPAGHVRGAGRARSSSTASSIEPCAATALVEEFKRILDDYVERRYPEAATLPA